MCDIVKNVDEFIKQYKINGKILVALSGGCDSIVLLHVLSVLKFDVVAIHLNHNWRAGESLRDEKYAKEFANSLGIQFYSEKLSNKYKKTESDAREARYAFFEKCAKKFNSEYIFLAHNKNDNAETLLYRVFKGTGLKGLCSIPKKRGIFYRPLLNIGREEIEKYAKKNNLKYVFDSSNNDIKYKRNFIRKEIIPLAKEINPDVICALNNLANLANMHYLTVLEILEKIKKDIFYKDKIILSKFLNLNLAFKYEIINDFIGSDLKFRDFKRIKSYVEFIEKKHNKNAKKSINKNLFLEISNGYIFKTSQIQKNDTVLIVNKEGEYNFCDKKIVIKKVCKINDYKNGQYLNLSFDEPIVLRTRRDGDVFCPFGMKSGKMKLKSYLINKKIPRQIRDNLLLLAKGNEILCIVGLQISQKVAVCNTDNCYQIIAVE